MSTDELALLRTLRADVGELDAVIDLRIRARIEAGLAAATAAGASVVVGDDPDADLPNERETDERGTVEPDEFGLYEFDPTPFEADQRGDTPATLRPGRATPGPARSTDPDTDPDPVPVPVPVPGAGRDDAWDIAAAHLARDPDQPVRHPARSGSSRALRLVAAAAVLVLLVAGGAAIFRARSVEERPPGIDAAAAPLSVRDAVSLLRNQPARTVGPGEYQYTHLQVGERRDTVTPTGTQDPLFVTQDRQRWVAVDGSGREALGPESARPFNDPNSPAQDIGNAFDVPLNQPRGFAGLSYAELQALSTDPSVLRQQLLAANSGASRDLVGLARLTGRLLEQPATPPAVRGALLEMLEQDGLRSVGDRTDRLGRRGSGFVLEDGPRRWTYIVDRATGRVLGWEQRTLPTDVLESDSLTLDGVIPPVTDNTGGA